jgi:predicted acetyltransferase
METLELVKLSLELEDEYRAMVNEHLSAPQDRQSGFIMEPVGSDFAAYLRRLENEERGVGLPSNYVSSSTYLLVRNGKEVLGVSRLRHRLTRSLEVEGGHIGYMIRPSERRKGYGTIILKLTMEKAREIGLGRVLVTCYTENIGSARIILRNGGIPTTPTISPATGKQVSRYWIYL